MTTPINYKALLPCLLAVGLALPATLSAQRVSPGEILFKANPTATKATVEGFAGILNVVSIAPRPSRTKIVASSLPNIYKADLAPGHDIETVLANLESRLDVIYAQPNHIFQTFQTTNDPRLSEQFHLDQINWPALMADLPAKERDVVVGVIDSGIDTNHEDLSDRIWVNEAEIDGRPGVDDDHNGYIDDLRGWDFTDAPTLPGQGDFIDPDNDPSDESSHGTQVAGVIGAISDNGIGVAGVADCRLMAVRAGLVFDQGGTFLQEDDLAAAIFYAVDNGADILNLSWGSFDRAFVIQDAIRYATDHGVIVVAAAGNSGRPPVAYPAALESVISVSAVETSGQLASFSSYGPTLDLVAPGVNIISTRLDDTYGPRSGSSFAAPQVAGLAALLLSRQPQLTAAQVRGALVASTQDLGDTGWDFSFGSGQIDAAKLIDFVRGTATPTIAQITSPAGDSEVSGLINIEANVSGNDATAYRLSWSPATAVEWSLISSGSVTDSIQSNFVVPENADSTIVLRLEVDVNGAALPVEHRVRLRANTQAPELTSLFYGPILEADHVAWLVRWVTDRPTFGSLLLVADGGLSRDTLSTGKLDRFHEARLPPQAVARNIDFQILMESSSGSRTTSPSEPLTQIPARIPAIGFNEIGVLPNGFLADRTSDFDNDGLLEVALMPYVEGESFSPVKVYEFQAPGSLALIHTTNHAVLPWNVHDVTHDGRPDLLGTSVARIRLLTGSPLPTNTVLDQSGLWGGEMADADGDGANEILARSLIDHSIRIIRFQTDGQSEETASLIDFSSGSGEMGSRFVVTELDGNFRQDILVGDADGDLWSYEFTGGGYIPNILLEGDDDTDARIIGGGADLDGDGKKEIAVARAFENSEDALNGWWDLEIYQVNGSELTLEWVQRISGVTTPGNGISTGDLDGDGRPELAVALIPDLYVIRADAPDTYRPIFHTPISLTYRPIISDLDRDGSAELIYNTEGAVRIAERTLPADEIPRPEILEAISLGPHSVRVSWMPSSGADTYRLYRSSDNSPDSLVNDSAALSFVDDSVSSGALLVYRVEAVSGEQVTSSGPAGVVAHLLPTVLSIDRVDSTRIGVLFSTQMGDSSVDPNGYRLFPLGETPSSAVRDQGSLRIVLTFEPPIQDGVTHTLAISSATDLTGASIDAAFQSISFTLGQETPVARADFDGDGIVGFGDFLQFAGAFGGNNPTFDLDEDGLVGFSDFLLFASLFGQRV
jgi:subtilisin family serine protease